MMNTGILDPGSRKVLRSFSLPHVDLKRLKLVKVDSNISEDSSSGYKDSGVEAGEDNSDSNIQQDYPSLASSGVIGQNYPSQGSEESEQQSGRGKQ